MYAMNIFLPHSAVISGIWPWFLRIWEWFLMFLWSYHRKEIESIMGTRAEWSSPSWVSIPQKSLTIAHDFWNTNSLLWTLFWNTNTGKFLTSWIKLFSVEWVRSLSISSGPTRIHHWVYICTASISSCQQVLSSKCIPQNFLFYRKISSVDAFTTKFCKWHHSWLSCGAMCKILLWLEEWKLISL